MIKNNWLAYTNLAWTEFIISTPEEYKAETEVLCKLINEYIKIEPKNMLHLGCGAGLNDWIFKEHFEVTGADISENMLKMARELNPNLTYICGDMRTLRLNKNYDAVVIPDSIGYMTTTTDLGKAISTAYQHLKPGGVFLVVTHIQEEFQKNNFVYTGSKGGVEITVFENNYIPQKAKTTYEATFIYLIRKKGKLNIYTDCHTIGLFKQNIWLKLLEETGFELKHMQKGHFYDGYILGEGEYPLTIFICIKPLKQKPCF